MYKFSLNNNLSIGFIIYLKFKKVNSKMVKFIEKSVFGSVVECSTQGSRVVGSNPPFI